MPTISFNTFSNDSFKHFKPVLAKSVLPEWWKKLKVWELAPTGTGYKSQSLRACPAMNDWLGMGWYILANRDIEVVPNADREADGKTPSISWQTNEPSGPGSPAHPSTQVQQLYSYGRNGESNDAFKFKMPWNVSTPMGYSVLYLDPFLFGSEHFTAWHGVIDSDTFNTNSDTSQVIMYPLSKKTFVIKKGTPIVQVVPFKRETWSSSIVRYSSDTMIKNQMYSTTQKPKLTDHDKTFACPSTVYSDHFGDEYFTNVSVPRGLISDPVNNKEYDVTGCYKSFGYWTPKATLYKTEKETFEQLELDL